ncbi:uracil-DNA glycosylase [Coraliomargarita akajimensis]|nr:uracil-DNA glycosylase [Coraliomargarita akajimensis]
MATAINAIYHELKRLQREGVDRMFVDDSTLRLLNQASQQAQSAPSKNTVSASTTAVFQSLIKSTQSSSEIPASAEPTAVLKPQVVHAAQLPPPPKIDLPEGDAKSQLAWLRERVEQCETCNSNLNLDGRIVFGEGSPNADIFFCGEAPGADEEIAGQPFVGKAGQLLTKIISAMGLSREDVYIGNILKWRPQHDKPYGNRPPTEDEMNFCLPYLKAQLEIIQPKVIVALGNTAVSGLLGQDPNRRLGQVRGNWHDFNGTDLMITFHPSYLLRNDTMKTKRLVWEDMLKVMERIGLEISDKQRAYFLPKN